MKKCSFDNPVGKIMPKIKIQIGAPQSVVTGNIERISLLEILITSIYVQLLCIREINEKIMSFHAKVILRILLV